MEAEYSLQLTARAGQFTWLERSGLALIGLGLLCLLVAFFGAGSAAPQLMLILSIGLLCFGGALVFRNLARKPAGVDNNGVWFSSATARGMAGWIMAVVFTGFYILLYWSSNALEHLVRMTDGLSYLMREVPADQWFLYGFFYTMAVLIMGVRMIVKYRNIPYQLIRTVSVMFFQLGFAFILPGLLRGLNQPEYYFSYFWPLKYDYLWPSSVDSLLNASSLGVFMVFWGVVLSIVVTPILTYFYGKRWYCSWVCGCGGLAETAGDPFRHLSDKSLGAWKIERWMVHSVLVIIVATTALLWINAAWQGSVLGSASNQFAQWYGFFIGLVFSGVIGVGFYPLMGARVWCRFGCPMAAILGLLQKYFSRFRITTNGGQCISCGNCSTYCEMGIDVRWYAQRGQNIIRASCVGCGMCAAVCPRGVLRLENGPRAGRYNGPVLVHHDEVSVQLDDDWVASRPLMPPLQEDIPILTDAHVEP